MKHYMGNARNISLVEWDGKLEPCIEVLLILREKHYECDTVGDLRSCGRDETVRFAATAEVLRALATNLVSMADDAEALAKKYGGGSPCT